MKYLVIAAAIAFVLYLLWKRKNTPAVQPKVTYPSTAVTAPAPPSGNTLTIDGINVYVNPLQGTATPFNTQVYGPNSGK